VNGLRMRVVVSVAAFACSAPALAERGFTSEFVSGATRPKSIALLPVDANVTRARVVETEGLLDQSVAFGGVFNTQVETLLHDKGYQIQIVDADRINTDPSLQEYVIDAKRAYDEMMTQYRPKRLERRIYNGGDSVKLLAAHLGVDAVVFSKLNMTITPAGKAIVSALIGGQAAGANAVLGIVDGDTGDLEVVQMGIALVTPGEKTDQEMQAYVATLATNSTKRIPSADPSAHIEVAAGDDEVLDELESLLE
jgi:hypothetical protein